MIKGDVTVGAEQNGIREKRKKDKKEVPAAGPRSWPKHHSNPSPLPPQGLPGSCCAIACRAKHRFGRLKNHKTLSALVELLF